MQLAYLASKVRQGYSILHDSCCNAMQAVPPTCHRQCKGTCWPAVEWLQNNSWPFMPDLAGIACLWFTVKAEQMAVSIWFHVWHDGCNALSSSRASKSIS